MAIEKRTRRTGKVTYRTRLRLNDGGDISATFARKSDAQDWEAKVRGEVRSGKRPRTPAPRTAHDHARKCLHWARYVSSR